MSKYTRQCSDAMRDASSTTRMTDTTAAAAATTAPRAPPRRRLQRRSQHNSSSSGGNMNKDSVVAHDAVLTPRPVAVAGVLDDGEDVVVVADDDDDEDVAVTTTAEVDAAMASPAPDTTVAAAVRDEAVNDVNDDNADVDDDVVVVDAADVESGDEEHAEGVASPPSPRARVLDDDASSATANNTTAATAKAPRRLYTCDLCAQHGPFDSIDALTQHALRHHSDVLPDYAALCAVSRQLVPVWPQVCARRRDAVVRWGRKIWAIAAQRDGGPAKMAEAHRARAQLELVVRQWQPAVRVFMFGSSVAFAVWDGVADIDFTVVDVDAHERGAWPPLERTAVRAITELLRRAGFAYASMEPISHARVPIIKHHALTPLRVCCCYDEDKDNKDKDNKDSNDDAMLRRVSGHSLAAEAVMARSVRFVLSGRATPYDRVLLEGSVRSACGDAAAVQQVWWNRTSDVVSLTCASTTAAMAAATCPLQLYTPHLRARVQALHEECKPELHNLDFDLSFRVFGVRNSLLLRRYLMSHPCARPGAIVLKDWSKTSGVNNSVNGYLTSYAVNILWIYYLVHKGHVAYVDPERDIPASLRSEDKDTLQAPAYCPMVPPHLTREQRDALDAQAGELLLGFFYFYTHEFDWQHHVVSLNRPGITTKAMLAWESEDVVVDVHGNSVGGGSNSHVKRHGTTRYLFCIEDPYEDNLNLGRHMGITRTLRVLTELHRALLSLLKDDEHQSCVFAASDAVDARRRAQQEQERRHLLLTPSLTSPAVAGRGKDALQLPRRVLWRLSAVCIRHMSRARRARDKAKSAVSSAGAGETSAAAASVAPSHDKSVEDSDGGDEDDDGVPQAQLEQAMLAAAPLEYRLARKVWNWQQLMHRLGYKVQYGCVRRRREVGFRRPLPRGLVASPSAEAEAATATATDVGSGSTDSKDATTAATTMAATSEAALSPTAANARVRQALLQSSSSRSLSEHMLHAHYDGYMRLTPEWVAWTQPWAALWLRNDVSSSALSLSPLLLQQQQQRRQQPQQQRTTSTTSSSSSSGSCASTTSTTTHMAAGALKSTPRHNASPWLSSLARCAVRCLTRR